MDPFIYRPLQCSEIRLISIEAGEFNDPIKCVLEHVSLEKKTVFIALSYVWGNPTDTVSIYVNDRRVFVTRNLYYALRQLRASIDDIISGVDDGRNNELNETNASSPHLHWFWADAVCINQGDLDEKAKQLPRMGNIYSSASIVVGWLGLSEEVDDGGMMKIVFDEANNGARRTDSGSVEANLVMFKMHGDRLSAFLRAYGQIMSSPWFSRIWVVQEAVLSRRDPLVFFGRYVSPISGFLSLLYNLFPSDNVYNSVLLNDDITPQDDYPERYKSAIGLLSLRESYMSSEYWQLPHGLDDFDESIFAIRLIAILKYVATGYSATLPHDMIYGLLGLARPPPLPNNLIPNYAKPFKDVYREYTQFILERTGDLTLISRCSQEKTSLRNIDRPELPSWVPDFRLGRTLRNPELSGSVFFSPDGKQLTVDGVKFGQCISVLPPQQSVEHTHVILQSFEDIILSPACHMSNRSFDEVLESWLKGWHNEEFDWGYNDDDAEARRDVYKMLATKSRATEEKDWSSKPDLDSSTKKIFLRFLRSLRRSSTVVAEDGTICSAQFDSEVKPDDIICFFKGSAEGSILRPRRDGYEFLGSCSLRCELAHEKFDKDFFLARQLQTFTLV